MRRIPVNIQQLTVPPQVVIATSGLERHPEGVERIGVVVLIQGYLAVVSGVSGVDLHDATLLAIRTPDDDAIPVVVGQAHPNLRRPRAAGSHALLPDRVVVVMLQPAVVFQRIDCQEPIIQLKFERAACIDPVAQQDFPIINILRGSRDLELSRVARDGRGDRTVIEAKRLAELDRDQIPLGGDQNHCRGFVIHHHRQRGLGGNHFTPRHAANHGVNRPGVVRRVTGQLQNRAVCPGDVGAVLPPLILDM